MQPRTVLFFVFLISAFIRSAFIILYGKSGFEYLPVDSHEYGILMEKTLNFDFNFDIGRFVRSPLYPFFMAFFKWAAGEKYWQQSIITVQVILSSSVSCYLYLISSELFKNKSTAFLTGIFSAIYLPAFYYTGAFTTETLYLFLTTSGIYYFILYSNSLKSSSGITSALLFALCFMLRPEVLLFIPFLVVSLLYLHKDKILKSIVFLSASVLFILLFALPWGTVNQKKHHTFIASGNGAKCAFYIGNSYIGYVDAVAVPPRGTEAYRISRMGFSAVGGPVYDSIMALPQKQKQEAFLKESFKWIKDYPEEWLKLKGMFILKFFIPGVSWHHYSLKEWLFFFLISLPVYLLAFIGLTTSVTKETWKQHLWFAGKLISSFLFLVVFLYGQRYRAYTIEVFYLIYAAAGFTVLRQQFLKLILKLHKRNKSVPVQ